jgi:transposase
VRRLARRSGIGTLTGLALAIEIGDCTRFTGAGIGAFMGWPQRALLGHLASSGADHQTGNGHVRRLLSEAAWHHPTRYLITKPSATVGDLAPAAALVRGDVANRRLHHRWVRFIDHKKQPTTASAAIARELAGWCWSLAVLDDSATR